MIEIFLIFLSAILFFFSWEVFSGFIWGAGYEPVPRKVLDVMIELSKPEKGKKVYDLGSGFGRIVIEVAKRTGAECIGVEIDPIKCWWSKLMVKRKGLQDRVKIIRKNLFEVDVSDADIIFLFLWSAMMPKLEKKLKSEMKPGSIVVSYWHRFEDWIPEKIDVIHRVYLYRV